MKVLMIEHYLPDSIYSLELGQELKKHCDLSILCRANAGADEEGITWLPYLYQGGEGKIKAVFEYGISLWRTASVIKKGRYDAVHIQTFKDPKLEMSIYRRYRKYLGKLVYTVHNVMPHEISSGDRKLYQGFYDLCDELIVHNETSGQCLEKEFHIPRDKIKVIPHGAYQTHLNRVKRRETGGIKHFLQFGVIRRYKGIDILLDAVALIPDEKRKNMRFTIAGKQFEKLDDTDYEKKIRDQRLEDCVKFSGDFVPEEEIQGLFGNADFLLFPYRSIYGSGALMMAYTYDKPVIASDIPTFVEETEGGRTGILFESEDPQALADAIIRAYECDEEQIREYEDSICSLVSEKYNWERSAERTAEVYRK